MVLIVEYNRLNADYYKRILGINGMTAIIADTQEAAEKAVRAGQVEITLMTVTMKCPEGKSPANLLRGSFPVESDIPIIALSSVHIRESDAIELLSMGYDDFLLVPVRGTDLLEKIRSWLLPINVAD